MRESWQPRNRHDRENICLLLTNSMGKVTVVGMLVSFHSQVQSSKVSVRNIKGLLLLLMLFFGLVEINVEVNKVTEMLKPCLGYSILCFILLTA